MLRAIKNFFGREQKSAPNLTFDELASIVGAGPTAAGVSVTPETALRSTTVLACCKVIAESVAQLPVHLYRRDGDARERVTDHPLSAVLGDAANEWTTASDFRGEMQLDLLKRGEAFAFINRVARGGRRAHPPAEQRRVGRAGSRDRPHRLTA